MKQDLKKLADFANTFGNVAYFLGVIFLFTGSIYFIADMSIMTVLILGLGGLMFILFGYVFTVYKRGLRKLSTDC